MPDDFRAQASSLDSPARSCLAIAPHDTNNLISTTRAIYVGTGGDITLIPADGTASILFKAVPQGTTLPVRAKRVLNTGTSASDLVALW